MVMRDELLAALTIERYDGRWWSKRTEQAAAHVEQRHDDNDITCARRRRELVAAWDEHVEKREAVS